VRDLHAGLLGDQFGEFTHAVGLGHLVKDADLVSARRRILQGDLDAPDRVADMDKGARLSAVPCTVNG